MSSAWRMLFLVSHIVQWVFIICLLKEYPFVDRVLYSEVTGAPAQDAFSIATQIGRFDFASLLLTVLGITLTIAGIFGFIEVRSKSEAVAINVAKPIAEKVAKQVAKDTAEAEIKPEARRLIEDFFDRNGIDIDKLPRRNSESSENGAQEIADALDLNGDENAG